MSLALCLYNTIQDYSDLPATMLRFTTASHNMNQSPTSHILLLNACHKQAHMFTKAHQLNIAYCKLTMYSTQSTHHRNTCFTDSIPISILEMEVISAHEN